jgi:hypothetical protein
MKSNAVAVPSLFTIAALLLTTSENTLALVGEEETKHPPLHQTFHPSIFLATESLRESSKIINISLFNFY